MFWLLMACAPGDDESATVTLGPHLEAVVSEVICDPEMNGNEQVDLVIPPGDYVMVQVGHLLPDGRIEDLTDNNYIQPNTPIPVTCTATNGGFRFTGLVLVE